MRTILFILFTVIYSLLASAESSFNTGRGDKSAQAYRIGLAPQIDGIANDSVWKNIPPITDFRQYLPVYDHPASFPMEVKIAYDNYAIYVLACMYDPHPDSILRQLGLRDEEFINADAFKIEFDTYNNQMDAYSFMVTSSGVQLDARESDETYDAVWDSEVKITREGWVAELKIPYSALRFARKDSQTWGLEINRIIRRYRETDQWSLELPQAENDLPYWGKLQGIENIEPPLRLSATPYVLLQAEHYPNETTENDISTSVSGGMDMKLGISESYTLDISLLPDFSQVQSDNKVKNLTAFETVFDEQRPFFKEAVDLFMKGDLLYSRRIGKTPALFYNVDNQLNDGEVLKKNPVQQKLLNATKISGRNKHGLAIGLLNAITGNTYAIVQDANGNERKILTDPLTNYNLLVFDQALKHNSSFYITNTNVIRDNHFRDANVTATGLTLNDKTNTYRLVASGSISQVFSQDISSSDPDKKTGFNYGIAAMRTNGNFQWSIGRYSMNDKYDANDMGLTIFNNYNSNTASISYNFYKPFWILRDMSNTISITNQNNYTTHKPETAKIRYNTFLNTLNYLTIWMDIGHLFAETYDYYEPRTEGRYYMRPKSTWSDIGFSSDYRKPFALDGSVNVYYSSRDESKGFEISLSPIFRVNNHFTFKFSSYYERNLNDYGYVTTSEDQIIFGKRDIITVVNSISSKYLFKNNLSLSLIARNYDSQGKYDSFFSLLDNGKVESMPGFNENHDFNFNSFNIDMVFSWIFSPGSSLNIVWKNDITNETDIVSSNYFSNFNETFNNPQLNSLSLKLLYYIDYQRLKGK